jgi:hypothetical protein
MMSAEPSVRVLLFLIPPFNATSDVFSKPVSGVPAEHTRHAGIVNRVHRSAQLRTRPGLRLHETIVCHTGWAIQGKIDMSPDVFHGSTLCSCVRNVGCWGGDGFRLSSLTRIVPVSACAVPRRRELFQNVNRLHPPTVKEMGAMVSATWLDRVQYRGKTWLPYIVYLGTETVFDVKESCNPRPSRLEVVSM